MTHEFKKIIQAGLHYEEAGMKCVLATVVALEGSSYRKPGVRMLIAEDGAMTGAVSGGCVEKEILHQAQFVFNSGKPKIMTYDGRYRLGCEGILYILLEAFEVSEELQEQLQNNFKHRKSFKIASYFSKEEDSESFGMSSVIKFENDKKFFFSEDIPQNQEKELLKYEQELKPLFKLLIFGAEHDAVQLCLAASLLGWEVSIIASPKDPRTRENFPGAEEVLHLTPEESAVLKMDAETAVVLMNHNYATDFKFLLSLKDKKPVYIGVLGSAGRREKLFHEIIELYPEIEYSFLDRVHGPAGLNIGAITPQEIAISIISEILTVVRQPGEVYPLREKQGNIHT